MHSNAVNQIPWPLACWDRSNEVQWSRYSWEINEKGILLIGGALSSHFYLCITSAAGKWTGHDRDWWYNHCLGVRQLICGPFLPECSSTRDGTSQSPPAQTIIWVDCPLQTGSLWWVPLQRDSHYRFPTYCCLLYAHAVWYRKGTVVWLKYYQIYLIVSCINFRTSHICF